MSSLAITHLQGTVTPSERHPCSPEQLRELLRAEGILAAVGRQEQDALARSAGIEPTSMPLVLAVAAYEDQALTLTPDGVRPGMSAADLCHLVATATGCETELAGEWSAGHPDAAVDEDEEPEGPIWVDVDAPEDAPAVLLCRIPDDMLPVLARDVRGPIEVARVDGWRLVRLTNPDADLSNHGWLTGETPVVTLTTIAGQPYLDVLVGWGVLPGHVLTRLTPVVPTFAPHEVEPALAPVVEALADLNLAPDSQLSLLLAEEPFASVDRAAVVAAVQSSDDGWHARVLAALGLPTVAADAFAGAPLAGSEWVEPSGGVAGTLRAVLSRYERASSEEIASRGPLGRMYGAAARRPLLALVSIVPEVVIGGLALAWELNADDRAWWMWGVRAGAVLLLLDAAADLVLMVARLRRRGR